MFSRDLDEKMITHPQNVFRLEMSLRGRSIGLGLVIAIKKIEKKKIEPQPLHYKRYLRTLRVSTKLLKCKP